MIWTKENIELVKSYLQQGLTRRQIAQKMNISVDSLGHCLRSHDLSQYRVETPRAVKIVESIDMECLDEKNFDKLKEEAKSKWVPVKTKIKKNKKSLYKTMLVSSDQHIPHQDDASINAVLKLMNDVKFDIYVELGDFLDFGCISHWNQGRNKTLEMQRLKTDYIKGNVLLDEIDKRLPEGCEKHFFKGNHECLDDQTELLTKNKGWIKYNEIHKEDLVLSFNPDTYRGEWVNIDNIIIQPFSGLLNKFNSVVIDLKATDNHKIFSHNRQTEKFEYIKIKNLTNSRYQIPVSCSFNKKKEYYLTDDEIALTGWILTDGSISKKYGYISISQSKETWENIKKLADNLHLSYKLSERQRDITEICGRTLIKTTLPAKEFSFHVESSKKLLEFIPRDKSFPNWITKLSNRQFEIFLNSLIDGDGSRHTSAKDSSFMLYGKEKFLSDVQKELIQRGYSASLSIYRRKDYRLNINKRTLFNFEGVENITKEYYNGNIWDLTVKNHNFMIRRNGKCHFTGNCWIDDLIEKTPQLEGLVEPESQLKLNERGYKIHAYNDIIPFGKLNLTHGIYAGSNPTKKHLDELKVNIMFGHTHTMEVKMSSSAAREIAFSGYNVGCLCNMMPDYMKNRPSGWTHGIAVVYLYDNGHFEVNMIRILNGRFIYNGKIYQG